MSGPPSSKLVTAAGDNALHGAGADAELAGYLQDAVAFGAKQLDAFFDLGINARPAKRNALGLGPRYSHVDALANDAAFELGEYAQHLEHGLARGCRSIKPLLGERNRSTTLTTSTRMEVDWLQCRRSMAERDVEKLTGTGHGKLIAGMAFIASRFGDLSQRR
jgi:hypothetical protein